MREVILALGLLLSTASQLRLGDSTIGPGEFCLAIWIAAMFGEKAIRLGPVLTPALSRLLVFWSLFAVSQCLGTLTGYVIGDRHDPSWFAHDVLAYALLAVVSWLSVVDPGARLRLQRVAWLLVLFGTASLALQLATASKLLDIAVIDPWYWDRFRGWSANPNQLALLCAFLALLALYVAEASTRVVERMVAFICIILSIWVGHISKSDTFNLALVGASLIFSALKFRVWLSLREQRLTSRTAFAWIFVLAAPAVLASAAPLSYSITVEAASIAKEMSKEGGKGTEREAQLRFQLWNEAIDRGLESGMLGLGPGPHLEIPLAVVASRMTEINTVIQHPERNSFPNFEAHSTLLDLFTQGGLIAVLSVVWIAATTLSITFRAKLDALTTLLCGMAIFSISHLIIRHPLFWFAIALCLVTGLENRKRSAFQIGGW